MLPDITAEELKNISETVFGKIIDVTAVPADAHFSGSVVTAAGLRFFGDICGHISLLICEPDLNAAAALIKKQFGITVPIDCRVVFDEFINIFAGGVITELNQKYGLNLSISVPDKNHNTGGGTFSHIIAADNVAFKFNYCIGDFL